MVKAVDVDVETVEVDVEAVALADVDVEAAGVDVETADVVEVGAVELATKIGPLKPETLCLIFQFLSNIGRDHNKNGKHSSNQTKTTWACFKLLS